MQENIAVEERLAQLLSILQVNFKLPVDEISSEEREFIMGKMQFRNYVKGDFVYKQGHAPKGVYWMKSGRIKFTNRHLDGGEHTHFILHGNQFFGYRTVISNGCYQLSVEVMESSEIGFIPSEQFLALLVEVPKFMKALLIEVCSTSLVFLARTSLYSNKSVIQRLAISILLLQDKVAKLENSINPPVQLSRNELASYIGTSVEVVVRQLKKLEKMSLIELKGKLIYVSDLKGLMDLIDASSI